MIHRFLTAALIIFSVSVSLYAENNIIMVLGSNRSELTDLEDRILREELMRKISEKGLAVVPVMEAESAISENRIDIRSVKKSDVTLLCGISGARYFVKGSFTRDKDSLRYSIIVFDSAGKDIGTREIPLDLKEPVPSQWLKIAESAAEAVKQILLPPSAK